MKYHSFTLRNFKGINDTTLKLNAHDTSNVVTLVGLNESGKTTVLEGIYSFSPDAESRTLFDTKILTPDPSARIPKNKLFSFNDKISIIAEVTLDPGERLAIKEKVEQATGLAFDDSGIPDKFTITDWSQYQNSKRTAGTSSWTITLNVRGKQAKKWRSPTHEEKQKIFKVLQDRLPSIAYFPTFLSDVPSKIYLRGHSNDQRNSFYKRVFQDILDSLDAGISIEDQILSRLEPPKTFAGTIAEAISVFWGSSSKQMVQQVIDKASAQLSRIIVQRWNEMFENSKIGKEIVIEFGVEEDSINSVSDPYISFAIKDGSNRFNIADRSLGFRWFFCFLLFTQFRAKRKNSKGKLFLFDEPASNLHAKAQEKLLDSLSDICTAPNALIYSTHSPYMINPYWLDTTYIVENTAVGADLDDIASMTTSEDTEISTTIYHDFIAKYPDRISHFQPILDRLEVKPNLMEIAKKCVLVEGKSDYVILSQLAKAKGVGTINFVPAHGATTMAPLIALLQGWGWPFAVLLDGDKAGKNSKEKYSAEYNLSGNVFTLSDISPGLKGIESLIDQADKSKISGDTSQSPTKKQIYSFFAVGAASGSLDLSKFKTLKSTSFKSLLENLEKTLN